MMHMPVSRCVVICLAIDHSRVEQAEGIMSGRQSSHTNAHALIVMCCCVPTIQCDVVQQHPCLHGRSLLIALPSSSAFSSFICLPAIVQVAPSWPKAYFRLAHACMAAGAWAAACAALEKGLPLLPGCEVSAVTKSNNRVERF